MRHVSLFLKICQVFPLKFVYSTSQVSISITRLVTNRYFLCSLLTLYQMKEISATVCLIIDIPNKILSWHLQVLLFFSLSFGLSTCTPSYHSYHLSKRKKVSWKNMYKSKENESLCLLEWLGRAVIRRSFKPNWWLWGVYFHYSRPWKCVDWNLFFRLYGNTWHSMPKSSWVKCPSPAQRFHEKDYILWTKNSCLHSKFVCFLPPQLKSSLAALRIQITYPHALRLKCRNNSKHPSLMMIQQKVTMLL